MPELPNASYSYRNEPDVPDFDDGKALFVFDRVCVICSGGASWIMRFDSGRKVSFSSSQAPLGQSLYRHFGIDPDESYLLITGGRAYTASAGYLKLCRIMGGAWHILRVGAIIPEGLRDYLYAAIARNRYRWFGKVEYCTLLTPEQRERLL
jgi:predicted DCC family thiol-disulfide oxidoreductase YuxK